MQTYISILRGINVSGKNIIKMESLKKMYVKLGFDNVSSYVQSGNIIFNRKPTDLSTLAKNISTCIQKEFRLEVPVLVFTSEQWKNIVKDNPFIKGKSKELSSIYVTFLASKPEKINQQEIQNKKQPEEEIFFSESAIYLYCPNGYGNTKLSNAFLENKLGVIATTRNWNTTLKLLEIAENI